MKKILAIAAFGFILAGLYAFVTPKAPPPAAPLKWYTWEEAIALNEKNPKKIMIDVYTDWCGWCKKMDKSTFRDEAVSEYLAANFYPVKLDAEQKADIVFNGQTFKYVDTGNGRGIHTLAYSLLDGNMSYPTVAYLNEKYERIMISPGFKDAKDMLTELKFAAEEAYNKSSWEDYKARADKQ